MRRLAFVTALFAAGIVSIPPLTALVAAPAAAQPTFEQTLNPAAVRDVQHRLAALGYYRGLEDGVWGRGTQIALQRFQRDHRLEATGQINAVTAKEMGLNPDRLIAEANRPLPPERVRGAPFPPREVGAIQRRLAELGYYRGRIDGVWGGGTRAALERFQAAQRIEPNGQPTRATIAALGFNPDAMLPREPAYYGSSLPPRSEAERLNERELRR
jgi:peptidoglycan hydrolase-like protein with peptidoglycan-binding domain